MDLIVLIALLIVLATVRSLDAAATLPPEEFLECLARIDEPAVVSVRHNVSWLLGAARHRYICIFRGHRIHTTTFRAIELPPDVTVIEVSKW